jgi:hypothetical protein
MTTEQQARIETARTRLRNYRRIEHKSVVLNLVLRSLGDVLEILDDQMKKVAALVADVNAYRGGKGIRANLVKAREENAGLRAQIHDLEEYAVEMFKVIADATQKAAVLDRLRGSEPHIRPDDTVMRRTTREVWVVAGVSRDGKRLILAGFPFPTEVDASEFDLIACAAGGQPEAYKDALRRHGLQDYVDPEEGRDSGAQAPQEGADALT